MEKYIGTPENGVGKSPTRGVRLRALTYLAPGIPSEFFQFICEHLEQALGLEIDLEVESRISGPMHGEFDPFAEGQADIGFLCSPSYLYLRSQAQPSIELVPAGFVFRDERAGGEPVYFSDVVVRTDYSARAFEDLAGTAWGYNDECSLSGNFAALQKLAELGCTENFFERRVQTGSHAASIEAILGGELDAAAIDSTVLARMKRESPELERELRVLCSWGPFPVQPIVVRRELGDGWSARIAQALLELDGASHAASRLEQFNLRGLVPIDDAAYSEERRALRALGQIPSLVSQTKTS
jgi:phosphonate transport system substrate-binding protein